MKDPDLRRCSPAARGVWMDMLCLMFECPERGVLASLAGPWTDQEIAGAVSGETPVVLAAINELVAKGVASRRADGAIVSRRLVRDEKERRADRLRQQGYRASKRHSDVTPLVTPSVTPLSVNEDEDESEIRLKPKTREIQFQLENFDGDAAFSALCREHPRPERSQRAEIALIDAVETLVRERQWSRQDAADYIRRQAKLYRDLTVKWPDKSYVKGLCNWLRDKTFEEDPQFWQKGAKHDAGTEAIRAAAERAAARLAGENELNGSRGVE